MRTFTRNAKSSSLILFLKEIYHIVLIQLLTFYVPNEKNRNLSKFIMNAVAHIYLKQNRRLTSNAFSSNHFENFKIHQLFHYLHSSLFQLTLKRLSADEVCHFNHAMKQPTSVQLPSVKG